jgi:tetratricopeptide (TPR) repeat protein
MRSQRWTGVAVFALALALRLAHVQQVVANDPFYDRPSVDSLVYGDWAKRIAAGDWLGSEPFFLSPLYGYFLAALQGVFGPTSLAPLVANALFGAATCALVYAIACRLFDLRVGLAAAALFAPYRMEIFYEGAALLEPLQTLVTTAVAWSALRALDSPSPPRFALAGALLGLAVLGRENAIVFAPAFAAWTWFALRPRLPGARRALLAGAYLAAVALLVLPATLRNWIVARDWVLVNSTGGIVLYTGWNPEANGVYVVPSIFPRALADDPVEQKNAYRRVAEERTGRTLRASEVSSYWRGEALAWIGANPRAAFALGLEKARLFWNAFEAWDIRSLTLAREVSWVLRASFVSFGILAPLALAGLALTAGRWRELIPLYLVIGMQFATAVAFLALSRYRVPAVPALAVFAGAGLVLPFDLARARRWPRLALGGAALLAGALAVNLNVPAEDLSMAHFNLGTTYEARGQLDLAAKEYLASLETAPRYISTWNNLALVYERSGAERELAIRAWQRVLDLARAQGSAMHVERAERHLRALSSGAAPPR